LGVKKYKGSTNLEGRFKYSGKAWCNDWLIISDVSKGRSRVKEFLILGQ
jgi:hypothetical protein